MLYSWVRMISEDRTTGIKNIAHAHEHTHTTARSKLGRHPNMRRHVLAKNTEASTRCEYEKSEGGEIVRFIALSDLHQHICYGYIVYGLSLIHI